jgi:hypothetical protein
MGAPRTRSEDRAVRGYGGSVPTDSRKIPNGFRANRNPGRDGRGGDAVSEKHQRDETERREREDRLRPKITASPKADAAWEFVAAALKADLPASTFALWLAPLDCIGEVDSALALEASEGILAWATRRYGKLIGETVRGETDYRGAFLFQQARTPSEGIL